MTREERESKFYLEVERDRRLSIPKNNTLEEMHRACCHFINYFLYTFNPKIEPYHFPFLLFDFQEDMVFDLIEAIVNKHDLFYDKCREMGASYTTLAVLLWFWLFVEGSNFLLGSRKEDFVDNTKSGSEFTNKEESLFGKLEYMLSRIYKTVLPKDFDIKKHMMFMSLINPELGNVISGESANDNFSRGGRQKAILLDEFAFWDSDNSAWGSTADTTDCRIVLTTPGIRPSKAKKLRFGMDGEEIKVVSLNHNLDPRKDNAWIEAQRRRRSKEDFAREIMIDWEGSLTGIVYPEIGYATKGNYPYDSRYPLYCSWDFGLDGVAIIWLQKNLNNKKIRVVDYYENFDKTIGFYFPFLGKTINPHYANSYTIDDIKAIRELKILKNPIHFGDPDVAKRSLITGTSTRHELEKEGISVLSNRMANDFASRREQTKLILQEGIEINNTSRTVKWLLCMENSRYPQRLESSQATTAINLPIHDWSSHGRTAFEYFSVNYNLGSGTSAKGTVISTNKEKESLRSFNTDNKGRLYSPDILDIMRESLPNR